MKRLTFISRRKRITPQHRTALLRAYQHSGLTQREFAQRQHLGYSTLTTWLRRARPKPAAVPTPPAVQFLPLQTIPTASAALYQVRWPNGLSLELGRGFDPAAVRQLLTLLPPCSR